MSARRTKKPSVPTPAPPNVPDLVLAPELAAIILLEHALDVARDALLAEHMTLVDDYRSPRDDGPVVFLASTICRRATAMLDTLRRYRRAVRDAARSDATDDDIPF